MEYLSLIISVVGWIVAISLAVWLRKANRSVTVDDKADERLRAVENQLLEMNVKVTPLWAKVQRVISEDLHHPHVKDKEMDSLLEQLEGLTISLAGRARLKELLHQRSTDMSPDVSESERASAYIMETVMDKVLEEDAIIHTKTELVAVPSTKKED